MRAYILMSVMFAISIGRGLALNVDTGDVEALKQALEQGIHSPARRSNLF
jgi:microcompartment protein CcmL/EutN